MNNIPLGEIAEIVISNVDKKSKKDEKTIRLCNFTDVYYNWAISKYHYDKLMRATANDNAIEKFKVKKGDVALTKDSETRDDIGVATYISEDFDDVVLGYHCALIRPNEKIILGKYLNVVLHTNYAQKYFEANASGSGQRYTITDSVIKDMPIPVPNIDIQRKIGEISSLIDRRIENNTSLSDNLISMARTIFDYWFLQYDFPNKDNKPYKSSGGKMKWAPKLKKEIPEDWGEYVLRDFLNCNVCSIGSNPNIEEIMYLDTSNLTENIIGDIQPLKIEDGYPSRAKRVVQENDILYSTVRPEQRHFGIIKRPVRNLIASTGFAVLSSKDNSKYNELFYLYITNNAIISTLDTIANSSVSSYPSINNDDILNLPIALPHDLSVFSDVIDLFDDIFKKASIAQEENKELEGLRDDILPLLVTGQAILES